MSEFTLQFIGQLKQTSVLEAFAAVTGIINVYTAARQWIICWFFAIASGILYCIFCFQNQFYLDSVLQFFYIVMGIIGWINWSGPKEQQKVSTWGIRYNLLNIAISSVLTVLLGWFFKTYTDQASPYLDAFILTFCLSATYMLTKRVHESWIYLIAIDILSIFLFGSKHFYLSCILYLIFTVLAFFGWWSWFREYKHTKKLQDK